MKENNPKNKPYVRTENNVLVSVRIETDIIKAIDEWCRGHTNFNRSIVINRLLYDCVALANPETFATLVSMYRPDAKDHYLILRDWESL